MHEVQSVVLEIFVCIIFISDFECVLLSPTRNFNEPTFAIVLIYIHQIFKNVISINENVLLAKYGNYNSRTDKTQYR